MANSRFSNLRRIDVFKAKIQTKEDNEEIKDDNSAGGDSAEDLVQIFTTRRDNMLENALEFFFLVELL